MESLRHIIDPIAHRQNGPKKGQEAYYIKIKK